MNYYYCYLCVCAYAPSVQLHFFIAPKNLSWPRPRIPKIPFLQKKILWQRTDVSLLTLHEQVTNPAIFIVDERMNIMPKSGLFSIIKWNECLSSVTTKWAPQLKLMLYSLGTTTNVQDPTTLRLSCYLESAEPHSDQIHDKGPESDQFYCIPVHTPLWKSTPLESSLQSCTP